MGLFSKHCGNAIFLNPYGTSEYRSKGKLFIFSSISKINACQPGRYCLPKSIPFLHVFTERRPNYHETFNESPGLFRRGTGQAF